MQLYRYEPGGVFGRHRDGPKHISENSQSLFTVLVYLNEGYEGGATTLFTDDLCHTAEAPRGTGCAFAMLQRTLHEGSTVTAGVKYALRFDVMLKRDSLAGVAHADILAPLSRTEKAKRWLRLAMLTEECGSVTKEQSVVYYQRSSKLDPDAKVDALHF